MSLSLMPAWVTVALFAAAPPQGLTVTAPSAWGLAAPGRVLRIAPGAPVALSREGGVVRARWPGGEALAASWAARGEGPWALTAGHGLRRVPGRWRCEVRGAGLRVRAAVPLEGWVAGALAAELPAGTPPAATEAQAVCIRTFAAAALTPARHPDARVCDATHCLRFAPEAREPRSHRAAREATRGRCLTWRGRPALTTWHATCGGWRSDATIAFGGQAPPYLAGGPDRRPDGTPWCDARPWQVLLEPTRVRADLAAAGLWPPGAEVRQLDVAEHGPGGHARVVRVAGDVQREVTGRMLWHALGPGLGWQGLRSLRFDLRPASGGWLAEGNGLGHGVGLCQAGARARAQAGASSEEILRAYFPGTRLVAGQPEVAPAPW